MADWRKLAKAALLADGQIDEREVAILRKELFADKRIDRAELEFLMEAKKQARWSCPLSTGWSLKGSAQPSWRMTIQRRRGRLAVQVHFPSPTARSMRPRRSCSRNSSCWRTRSVPQFTCRCSTMHGQVRLVAPCDPYLGGHRLMADWRKLAKALFLADGKIDEAESCQGAPGRS